MSAAGDDTGGRPRRRRMEIFAFLFLTAVLMPALAVATVGSYGLAVWIYQMLAGPPALRRANRSSSRRTIVARSHTAIDRRALITGRLLNPDRVVAPPGGEIASILVQARPERLAEVEAAIVALAGCEIYGRDPKGKLVVVVDAADAGALGIDAQHHRAAAGRLHRLARLSRHRRRLTPDVGRTAMTAPKLDRRQVLKLEAAAMAALAGGMADAGAGRQSRHRPRRQRVEMGQGAVPVLRHRLQRDGGDQGQPRGRHPWRHQVGGQSRPQLREGLFPFQDHVRPRPADPADAAQDATASTTRTASSRRCPGTRPSTSWPRSSRPR